jgi:hypothetical protein
VRGEITTALNRKLAPGVFLQGRAEAVQPVSVTPLADVLVVRVVAVGTADVSIR